MTTKHTPAPPLRLVTADEVRKWPTMDNRYFLAVSDPEHAARLFNRDIAYPRLVKALRACSEPETGDAEDTHAMRIGRALLRELGEE